MKKQIRYFKRPFTGTISIWVYYKYEGDKWYKMYDFQGFWDTVDYNIDEDYFKDLIEITEEDMFLELL